MWDKSNQALESTNNMSEPLTWKHWVVEIVGSHRAFEEQVELWESFLLADVEALQLLVREVLLQNRRWEEESKGTENGKNAKLKEMWRKQEQRKCEEESKDK